MTARDYHLFGFLFFDAVLGVVKINQDLRNLKTRGIQVLMRITWPRLLPLLGPCKNKRRQEQPHKLPAPGASVSHGFH